MTTEEIKEVCAVMEMHNTIKNTRYTDDVNATYEVSVDCGELVHTLIFRDGDQEICRIEEDTCVELVKHAERYVDDVWTCDDCGGLMPFSGEECRHANGWVYCGDCMPKHEHDILEGACEAYHEMAENA